MIKKDCKFLTLILFLTFCCFVSNVKAESVVSTEEEYSLEEIVESFEESSVANEKYEDLDDVFSDFANRMVLGVFGKTALVQFAESRLDEGMVDDILTLSDIEKRDYAKPFNTNLATMFLLVLKVSIVIVYFLLALYLAWMAMETLLRTEDAGEFLGKGWNSLFSPLKVMMVVLLITPMFGTELKDAVNASGAGGVGETIYEGLFFEKDFTLSQVIMLRVLGESNNYANEIWSGFVDTQQKHYPLIKMPRVDSKRIEAKNMIDFFLCLRAEKTGAFNNEGVDELSLKFKKNYEGRISRSPSYVSEFTSRSCEIRIDIPFDGETLNRVKTSNVLDEMGVSLDYENAQEVFAQDMIRDILEKANAISKSVVELIDYKESVLGDGSAAAPGESKEYHINHNNWKNHCDDFFAGEAKPEKLTHRNISLYQFFASQCLSRELIHQSANISDVSDMGLPYSSNNNLRGDRVHLCSNDSVGLKVIDGEDDLKTCIENACSNGSSFECSNALNLALSPKEREEVKEKGWILGGAYAYNFFSSYRNKVPQSLINGVSSDFKLSKSGRALDSSNPDHHPHKEKAFQINMLVDDISDSYPLFSYDALLQDLSDDAFYGPPNIEDKIDSRDNSLLFGDDGFIGINKFLECVKHPHSHTNGYNCNSVMEETQQFGLKLIITSVQLKIINKVLTVKTDMQSSTSGQLLDGFNSRGSGGAFDSFAGKMLNPIMNMAMPFSVGYGAGSLFDMAINSDDSFSDIEMDLFLNRDVLALSALSEASRRLLGHQTIVGDFMFMAMLIIGLLMGVVLPLLPFFVFLVAFSGYAILFFESLITILVWSVVVISPTRDHSSDYIKKGFVMILSVFLRAPLIVFGLIVAWILNNILIGEILSILPIDAAFDTGGGFSLQSYVDLLVIFGVQVFFLYLLYNLIFSIIEGFFEISQNWLFGNTSSSPFGSKDRKKDMDNVKEGMGQMKGRNKIKDLAGKR